MKMPFSIGDQKVFRHRVTSADTPTFPDGGTVHPVYSTYALTRDAEWAGRLFVLEMKDADDEGIGTRVEVSHRAPAMIGEEVEIVSTLETVERNEVVTAFVARVQDRVIAEGRTWQKIVRREKLDALFANRR